jgi:hypothetical protein
MRALLPRAAAFLALALAAGASDAARRLAQAGDCCAALAAAGAAADLPTVLIDSRGKPIPPKVKRQAATRIAVDLCTCGGAGGDYAGGAEAGGRGSSSAEFQKKSYRVKLTDAGGKGAEFPLLGMPADEDWILSGAPHGVL